MMRQVFPTLVCFLMVITSTAFCQPKNATITFKTTVFDFGIIKEDDGIAVSTFEFDNSGKAPLVIQRLISSCDCATIEWPKQPINPGESNKIKVSYDPKGRSGPFEKTITVYSNAETAVVVLRIKGIVKERPKALEEIYNRLVGEIRLKSTLISFGRIMVDGVKTDTLDFINMASEPIKIGYELNGLNHLSVKIVPEEVKPKEKGLVIVSFDAKKRNDWGFIIDRFYLTQNGKPIPTGIINITATIEENFSNLTNEQRQNAPKIEFKEESYDFGQIEEGQPVEKEFVFTNTGKSDLIIHKIKASCGCTTVEPADKIIRPGQSSSFKATVRTNGFSERIAKSITIITNDPVSPSTMVRIIGVVTPKKK